LKIVLDTNVLVSGILSPNGSPAAVLRALLTERVRLCFDERIVSEYRDVLTRTKFSFDRELVDELISFLESAGSPTLAAPLAVTLPDPWDQMFIEVAVSSQADFLVTGNLKHFPDETRAGVKVVSPRAFLDALLAGS
jgi:putative PIN family toxin of toxin-antitoxin system